MRQYGGGGGLGASGYARTPRNGPPLPALRRVAKCASDPVGASWGLIGTHLCNVVFLECLSRMPTLPLCICLLVSVRSPWACRCDLAPLRHMLCGRVHWVLCWIHYRVIAISFGGFGGGASVHSQANGWGVSGIGRNQPKDVGGGGGGVNGLRTRRPLCDFVEKLDQSHLRSGHRVKSSDTGSASDFEANLLRWNLKSFDSSWRDKHDGTHMCCCLTLTNNKCKSYSRKRFCSKDVTTKFWLGGRIHRSPNPIGIRPCPSPPSPPQFSFSLDFGHLILKMLGNAKF